jgi:hypothetical protein
VCGSWHTGHGTFLALEFSPRGRPRPREALPPARPPRLARPPPRPPPPPRPNANTGAGAFGWPVLLWNAGGAASDETAAARVGQSCTPDRGAAAPAPAGRAARTASAAAIVPGTLLSLALTAIRALSDRSAAGPGRDISPQARSRSRETWSRSRSRKTWSWSRKNWSRRKPKKLCETRPNCQLPQ